MTPSVGLALLLLGTTLATMAVLNQGYWLLLPPAVLAPSLAAVLHWLGVQRS